MLTLSTDRLLKVLVQNDIGAENEGGPQFHTPRSATWELVN